MPDKYLSLQTATRYCNYSQEYLSLRARQGKLKAIKFGRNWVTREEWLKEYLGQVETYVNGHINHAEIKKIILPPVNLPVEDSFPKFLELQFKKFKFPKPALQIRFGFIVALVFVSLITFAFHGKESFKIAYDDAAVFTKELNQDFQGGIVISNSNLKSQISKLGSGVFSFVTLVGGAGDIVASGIVEVVYDVALGIPQSFQVVYQDIDSQLLNAGQQAAAVGEFTVDNLKDYAQWLVQGYFAANDALEKNLALDLKNLVSEFNNLVLSLKKATLKFAQDLDKTYQFIVRPWRQAPGTSLVETMRPKPEEGVVVVPYSPEQTAEMKGKLEKAFSDNVEVKPDETGRGGIIKPLIKEAAAQEYLYLIVPVDEKQ